MINHVYISNNSAHSESIAEIVLSKEKGIEQLQEKTVDTSGSTIFIIDVHCTFIKAEKMQQQGGVIIYRHLLKIFEGKQDKLKVIFYSPLTQDQLVSLKPEYYVLKLLPFIECKYEEGQFEKDLSDEIAKYEKEGWVQFNNASENLLSGWALAKNQSVETNYLSDEEREKQINEQNPKWRTIAIIDDQLHEWITTYKTIFEAKTKFRFLHYNNSKRTKGTFDKSKIENLTDPKTADTLSKQIKDVDLVISDFYLEEAHESNNWMSVEELSKKSGFQLFETIKGKKGERGINKGVPYAMHTSSNKIQYYKFLNANGVDNWFTKDIRPNATSQEKRENFIVFKKGIEVYTSNPTSELYATLRDIWKKIEVIETWTQPMSWWDSKTKKPEILNLIKNSWAAIRSYVQQEDYVAENIGSIDTHFTPASVISNMCKILEMDFNGAFKTVNHCFHFLRHIRNAASHYDSYNSLVMADAIIYLEVWLSLLQNVKINKASKIFQPVNGHEHMIHINVDTDGNENHFKHQLLYIYLQYFNSPYSKDAHSAKMRIRKRINDLLQQADKVILLQEVLNHVMPKDRKGNPISGAIHLSQTIACDLTDDATLELSINEDKEKLFIMND